MYGQTISECVSDIFTPEGLKRFLDNFKQHKYFTKREEEESVVKGLLQQRFQNFSMDVYYKYIHVHVFPNDFSLRVSHKRIKTHEREQPLSKCFEG